MNNFPYPNINISPYNPYQNIITEINKLKYEIVELKNKISKLEKQNKKDYLKKEEGLYMM